MKARRLLGMGEMLSTAPTRPDREETKQMSSKRGAAASDSRRTHCVIHGPYSSWCKNCVQGHYREFAHAAHHHGAREAPTVSLDYAFLGDKGEVTSQEQSDTERARSRFSL